MRNMYLIGWLAALCVGQAALAADAPAPMGKDAFRAAQARIESDRKASDKACKRLKGNAREVCELQAKGEEKAAKAELEARYRPTPESEQTAKEVRADAEFATAKQRCKDLKDKPRDTCVKQARAAREAAVRQAKVEKVQLIAELKAKAEDQGKASAPPDTPAQQFKSRKAYCEMQGPDRDRCLAELKRRFNKS